MKLKELKKDIEKLYQECIGKLNCEDVDTSSFEEYKNTIIPFMKQAELKGIQETKAQILKEVEKIIDDFSFIKYLECRGKNVDAIASQLIRDDLKQQIKKLGGENG